MKYESLNNMLSEFFRQVPIISEYDLRMLWQKEFDPNDLKFHLSVLRNRREIKALPRYRDILQLYADGVGTDSIKDITGANLFQIRDTIEAAKEKRITAPIDVSITDTELQAMLFDTRHIFLESTTLKYVDRDTREILNRSMPVLCALEKPSDILTIHIASYPSMLVWASKKVVNDTRRDTYFDVTVIGRDNFLTVSRIMSLQQKECVPPGIPDTIKHIAVIPDEDLIGSIQTYFQVKFALYCVVDRNGVLHKALQDRK